MIGQALDQADHVVREIAESGRTSQQCDVRLRTERCQRLVDPARGRTLVDRRSRIVQQRAAGFGLLVAQDDTRPRRGRRERRGKAGRTSANHQHVTVRESLCIPIRIRNPRRVRGTCRGANDGLVPAMPRESRPHEGLVVEAGSQQRRQQAVDGVEVEAEARPAVLALGNQALVDLHLRRLQVRRAARGIADHRYQRIRFLGPCRQQSAWTVILERAAEQPHPVREQGGGERVAGEPLVAAAVEGKRHGPLPVDAPATGRALRGHGVAPVAITGGASPLR